MIAYLYGVILERYAYFHYVMLQSQALNANANWNERLAYYYVVNITFCLNFFLILWIMN